MNIFNWSSSNSNSKSSEESQNNNSNNKSNVSNSKASSSIEEWESRIRSVQSSRVTPEVKQRIMENAKKQQRATKSVQQAQQLERLNYLSSASNAVTLSKFKNTKEKKSAVTINYGEEQTKSASRSAMIQNYSRARKNESVQMDELNDMENDLFEEMREQQIGLEIADGGGFVAMAAPLQAQAAEVLSTELSNLLEQLAVEPTKDDELQAKFVLFETFLATVTTIREETLAFWEENKDQFNDSGKAACQKEIKDIDTFDSMSIQEDNRKWFVYYMTQKANINSQMISRILASLKTKLDLLSNEDLECPCCLDAINAATSTTLPCCHKVCTDCWKHWCDLKGANVFCPLCCNEAFVSEFV